MSWSGVHVADAGRQPWQPGHPWPEHRRHPAVVIDRAAAHNLEVLRQQTAWSVRIVKGIREAHAVDRILGDPVDFPRRRDAKYLVDRRYDVVHMMELRPRCRVRRDLRGPPNRHRVAGSTEVRRVELHAFVRRAAGPAPATMVLVVNFRRPEHIETTQGLERLDVHGHSGRNAVLRDQLADRAVLAFGRRPVVAPDVEDQRVLAVTEPIELVDEPTDLCVHVLGEPRRDLHQSSLEGLLVLRNAVPRRHPRIARRELGLLRNPSLLFRPREHALTILVPAVVELAFVLVCPLLHDVVRSMDGAARPVHVEGLVGLEGFMPAQPPDRIVGKIFAQVIALLGRAGRSDVGRVTNQVRLVLRSLAG